MGYPFESIARTFMLGTRRRISARISIDFHTIHENRHTPDDTFSPSRRFAIARHSRKPKNAGPSLKYVDLPWTAETTNHAITISGRRSQNLGDLIPLYRMGG